MGRGWQFLGRVDFERKCKSSDSLLPVVEGNLIGHIGSKAGRGLVTDKTEVAWAGLSLAAFTRNEPGSTAKHRHKASEKVVGEAGR